MPYSLEKEILLRAPKDKVWRTYRDYLPKLVPAMPTVDEIKVINREENESVGGAIFGAILGIIIGLTVWKNYASSNDKVKEKFILSETNIDILRIILTVITFILLLDFIYSTYKDIDTVSDAGYIVEED